MITRRRFLASTLAATSTGIVAGITAGRVMQPGPSVRFIGHRTSMIALIDTGLERALIVLGERDDNLLASIPGLKVAAGRRIDLVMASHDVLASRAARKHLQIDEVTTICVQSDASLPPIRGHVLPLTSDASLDLGEHASVAIRMRPTGPSIGLPDRPMFLVQVTMNETRLLFVDNPGSMRLAETGAVHLLAVPGEIGTTERMSSAALVVTTRADQFPNRPALQVSSTDPVVVRVRDGSIEVRENQLLS